MKLVVDIDKNDYDIIKYVIQAIGSDYMPCVIIANGTPLEKVLEDIKAEIEELKSCCDDEWDAFLTGRKEAYNNVLEIIDKHISGKEKE